MPRARLNVFVGVFGIAFLWAAAWAAAYALCKRNYGRAVDLAIALPPDRARYCMARAALAAPLYALLIHAVPLAAAHALLALDRDKGHPFAMDRVFDATNVFAPVYFKTCLVATCAATLAASVAFAVALHSARRFYLPSPGKPSDVDAAEAGLAPVHRTTFAAAATTWAVVAAFAAATSVCFVD
jgi:hypothetical protein